MQAQLDLEADLRIFEMYLANVDWSPPQFHANPDGENSAGVHERDCPLPGQPSSGLNRSPNWDCFRGRLEDDGACHSIVIARCLDDASSMYARCLYSHEMDNAMHGFGHLSLDMTRIEWRELLPLPLFHMCANHGSRIATPASIISVHVAPFIPSKTEAIFSRQQGQSPPLA